MSTSQHDLSAPVRLAALHRSALLDSPAEAAFDRLTRLASQILGVPVALVSLVDADRQFFKSSVGLPEPWATRRETPLSHSFCQHVVTSGEPLVIADARRESLVESNCAIADLGVVAYAGIPLVTSDAQVLGSFCAIDTVPRQWTERELGILTDLAATVMTEIELRAAASERRRAESALRESETRFRSAIEQVADYAIFTADRGGRATTWNEGVRQVLGYEEAEFVGLPAAELFTSEDRAAGLPEAELREAADRGSANDDRWMQRRDGTRFWAMGRTSAVRDEGGELAGFTKVMRDQTSLKRTTDALRESEQRYRVLTEVSPQIVWFGRADGFITYGNQRWFDLTGLTMAESEGNGWTDAIHPEHRRRVLEAWRAATAAGRSYEVEIPFRTRDGGYRWHLARGIPLRKPDGEVERWIGVAIDIDERKRAEVERERLVGHVQALLESAGEGMYGVDPDGRCTFITRAGAELLGYTPEEVLGRNMHALVHHARPDGTPYPEEECPIYQAFQNVDRARVTHEVLWRRDGTAVPVEYSARPLVEHGAVTGAVVTFTDISERQQAEEHLRQAQRMEVVGRLAGGIAHDLNNMLVAILGYAAFLRRDLALDDPRRADLDQITKAGTRSATLTRQLLAFARRQMIRPAALDLNAVVRDRDVLLRPLLGESIELEVALAPGQCPVYADRDQLDQVLLNLVLNARDAVSPGGRVTVATASVVVDSAYAARHPGIAIPLGRYAQLTVRDTGHGMDASTLAQIFEPFFTTKPVGQGTGLGLSMVYGAIKQSGGFVWATSEPDSGTCFEIILPEAPIAPAVRSAVTAEENLAGTGTIMVVEDDEVVRALVCRSLRDFGYTCREAASGTAALDLFELHQGPIDLVISDAAMPGMSGRELGRHLKDRRADLPVLYMSAYSAEEAIGRGLLDAEVPFLQKPFTPEELARRVRQVLARSSAPPATSPKPSSAVQSR